MCQLENSSTLNKSVKIVLKYNINRFKADVFSLGVTLLETISLIEGVHFYNFENFALEESRIKLVLEKELEK